MRFQLLFIILIVGVIKQTTAQLKIGDQPTITEKSVALDVAGSNGQQGLWLPRVADTSVSGIRAFNPPNGLILYHTPSGKIILRSNNAWVTTPDNFIESITVGATTMTGPAITYNTGTAGTDFGISVSGNTATWNLPDASTSARGAVTNGTQTFGGAKTFENGLTVNNGTTLNGGTTANGGLTVSGATGNNSNLTLGITSATTPAAPNGRSLSVDASGGVIVTRNPIIKTYSSILKEAPLTLNSGSSQILSFELPAANLPLLSTVYLSPSEPGINDGTSINWIRVKNATTIEVAFTAYSANEIFKNQSGAEITWNITVVEH